MRKHGRIGLGLSRQPRPAVLQQLHRSGGVAPEGAQPRRLGVQRLALGRVRPPAANERRFEQLQRLRLLPAPRGDDAKTLQHIACQPVRSVAVGLGQQQPERVLGLVVA